MIAAFTFSNSYAACAWYDVMCKLQGGTNTTMLNNSTSTTSSNPNTPSVSSTPPTSSPNVIQQSSKCDPSYPDFCIPPPPPDLNCADIPQKRFTVTGADPQGFDRDGDGIGCES